VKRFNLLLTLFTTPSFEMTYAYMSAPPQRKFWLRLCKIVVIFCRRLCCKLATFSIYRICWLILWLSTTLYMQLYYCS